MTSSYEYTPYIWPMLTAIGFTAAVGIYSWRHRSVPGAKGFSFMLLFWVLKLMASTLELTALDFPTKVFWFHIEHLCLLPATAAGLVFALEYAGLDRWLNRDTLALLAIPALILIPLPFTDDARRLIWTHIWLDGRVRYSPGIFAYGGLIYGLFLDLGTLSVLIWLFIRSPLHRRSLGLIFLNMFVSYTLFFLNEAGVNPVKPLDPLDLAANLISPVYFVALFHFRLFDVVPVARNRAIEQMRDGMLVLDAQARVAELNGAAKELLGVKSKVIGREAAQVLIAHPKLLELIRKPAPTQEEIWLGDARCYRVHISPLANRRGFDLGKLILLYDISEEKRAQKQLQDQQRKLASLEEREWLARELHDGVGQALAAAHLQVNTASELLARGQLAGAKVSLEQLAEVIREGKAHVGDYLFGVKTWSSRDQFFTGLRHYIASYNPNAGVRTELVIPPGIEGTLLGEAIETQLQRIIQEALTNIRKHASACTARVIFALVDGQLEITIEDDGQGFDPADLGDNQGFGLRAMRGRTESVGAHFDLNSSPGKGTKIIVRVPWKKGEP
jgi:PAS domain S-box-containing protein